MHAVNAMRSRARVPAWALAAADCFYSTRFVTEMSLVASPHLAVSAYGNPPLVQGGGGGVQETRVEVYCQSCKKTQSWNSRVCKTEDEKIRGACKSGLMRVRGMLVPWAGL